MVVLAVRLLKMSRRSVLWLILLVLVSLQAMVPCTAVVPLKWFSRYGQEVVQKQVLQASWGEKNVPGDSVEQVASIVPGTNWTTMDGQSIQAHGAGILVDVDGMYYWYGESLKTSDPTTHGVNCYSSKDLYNWNFVRSSITQVDVIIPGSSGPYTIERPKVLYNALTGAYVMWFHVDTDNYSVRRIGVAVAYSPTAPFTFVHTFQPDGLPSLDMTVYEDKINGTVLGAYLIRSVDNSYVGVSKLSDDYMTTTGLVSIIPEAREGHTMFYYQDRYYMLTSHLTGWAPNAAELFISNKNTLIGAEWTSLGNPTNSSTTYDSQSAFILPFPSTKNPGETFFIYMGDRWDSPNLLNASYIWLPIIINSNNAQEVSIPYFDSWKLTDY